MQACFGVFLCFKHGWKKMNKNRIKKIIIIASESTSFFNFRSELIRAISELKYSVTTISNPMSVQQSNEIASWECAAMTVVFSRNGLNLITDFKTLFNLFLQFRSIQPDIILAYTIKPVIWGGLSARFCKADFYALITGLGFAFHGKSLQRKFLTKLVTFLYKIALKNSKAVIFQNTDNRDVEESAKDFGVSDKVHLIGQVDNPFYLLKKSDIFVLNSETEGFPNVLIEAMACGLPVISSNCKSGPNEILNNEEFGRLYEVGDIEALAGCIEDTLLLDNSKLKNIRNKNIERANDFDINKSINKFIEVL